MEIFPTDPNVSKEPEKVLKKEKSKRTGKKSSQSDATGFFAVLSEKECEVLEKNLQETLDEILDSGNAFVRSPTERNLRRYKESIKKFLMLLEKRLYRIKDSYDIREKKVRLNQVAEIVDQRLKEIAEKLMENERSTLNFAAKIDEINGLLLDLYR
ncbi:MAG: uncharacterized protein PWP37_1693 [Thermotogota bacterium]|nr:uncharacterized protein [Thermotogota bacterium]MDK2865501.1 uncharacterized protein [Thermotogota bacterium]HCZ05791.1 DUF327 domain-containing protein [Thermotogota bacterium]